MRKQCHLTSLLKVSLSKKKFEIFKKKFSSSKDNETNTLFLVPTYFYSVKVIKIPLSEQKRIN